ncbi:helix-turn-helix domain-containing protein [Solibacillus sp. FSL H8-0523]|uniref:helix-turn-helix domain-containing protein n=1 Tax=Solibacillus sp. FSL H8-0523 TaxID=2954511 RepID=UPI0031016212
MHDNQLGFEIARIRKELKMTQKQLSQGICTQPTISMIEKGEIQPGIEILLAISIKLKKSITHFINILLMSNYTYVQVLVEELEELTTNQRYDKVYAIVSEELYKKPEDYWFQTFLKWKHYGSAYYLKKATLDETLEQLILLVQSTDDLILNRDFLKDRIYNTIAFLYSTRKDYHLALFYYNKIDLNNIISEAPRLNYDIYRLRVMYNKTKTLYDMGDYEKSVEYCKTGIKKSVELENMSFIGNFHYYLGQCYEKMKMDKEQIKGCYINALFFFQLLNRELYVEIIKKEKQIYL